MGSNATGDPPRGTRVLAIDYGEARTGVAISDPTGTLARPLEVVGHAGSGRGLERVVELARREGAERVVVGLPLTLKGERGEQARATEHFVEALRARIDLPVETFDERFTTRMARRRRTPKQEDAIAAAYLLTGYLTWRSRRDA
jgi:putative Holliday junction resolvase